MDDGLGVHFSIVYNGSLTEQVLHNLHAGIKYTFYVSAVNFNGEGPRSDKSTYRSCVEPSDVLAPELVISTSTTAYLRWLQPNEGGCPVTSFSVFSDLGNFNAGFVNNLEPASVQNHPYLFEHTFTFNAALTGTLLRFKLLATNEIGSTMSDNYLQILLAGLPPQPQASVTKVSSGFADIVVAMPLVTDDGGTTLDAYSLEVDDGIQGPFKDYYSGVNRTVTVSTMQGRIYRFRFRVQNPYGWSPYSEITYILAASVPNKPVAAPYLISVDATQLTLGMKPCGSGNGTPITGYVMYRKHKITGIYSEVAVISSDSDLEYQMTVAADIMVVGDHYFFHYSLRNDEGDSEISDEAEFLLSDYP
jgi:hypothetical protein